MQYKMLFIMTSKSWFFRHKLVSFSVKLITSWTILLRITKLSGFWRTQFVYSLCNFWNFLLLKFSTALFPVVICRLHKSIFPCLSVITVSTVGLYTVLQPAKFVIPLGSKLFSSVYRMFIQFWLLRAQSNR